MTEDKKTTAGQRFHRCQWQLDVIRENQEDAANLLWFICYQQMGDAKELLAGMHKNDRDALLQEGGILTSEQIELLK